MEHRIGEQIVGGAIGGYIGRVELDQQQPPAAAKAMESLTQRMKELESAVDSLTNRLQPVIRPVAQALAPGNQKEAPQPVRSPLADQIWRRHDEAVSLLSRLADLIDRLEV